MIRVPVNEAQVRASADDSEKWIRAVLEALRPELNRSNLGRAIDQLGEWFPEQALKLASHKELIIEHIVDGTEPGPDSPLRQLGWSKVPAGDLEGDELGVSPCTEAVALVVVDVIFFVISLAGLPTLNKERVARSLMREMGEETLNGFRRASVAIEDAWREGERVKMAKAVFSLFSRAATAGGLKLVLKHVFSSMSTWDRIKEGIIATLTLTAWLASDGLAFFAEAALTIMSAEQLIEDSVAVGRVC